MGTSIVNNPKMVTGLLQECQQMLDQLSPEVEGWTGGEKIEHLKYEGKSPVASPGCKTADCAELAPPQAALFFHLLADKCQKIIGLLGHEWDVSYKAGRGGSLLCTSELLSVLI